MAQSKMAAKTKQFNSEAVEAKEYAAEVCIIGGGISGILAAKKCLDRGLSYKIIDMNPQLGGCWHTLANDHSTLQAFEPNYRWSAEHKLSKKPLIKNTAPTVRQRLDEFVHDYSILDHALLGTRVYDVKSLSEGSYAVSAVNEKSGEKVSVKCEYLCVTCGILAHEQWSLEDRGIKGVEAFKGVITYAGRKNGIDSVIGTSDLAGKKVVIVGSGSFAAEAMEAAARQGCDDITIIGRPRYRWILPFSRQYTISVVANAAFIPWSWRMNLALGYLRKFFYEPCGLKHWAPSGSPDQMDFVGQCNDGYFRLSYQGKLKCIQDSVNSLEKNCVVLEDGKDIPCDVLVVASGLKFNHKPRFLEGLKVDFGDLHNFAFLGMNPRIGCASDFLFAYVPYGPLKQLDLFFHSIKCCQEGLEKEITKSLRPTPISYFGEENAKRGNEKYCTFFEYSSWWSLYSIAVESRIQAMLRTLDVGRSWPQRLFLRLQLMSENTAEWFRCVGRSIQEITTFQVYGKSVQDEHLLNSTY